MNDEKISIIVPVYNIELYLKRCVKSLLNQSYENFEVILVDDGSIDNSGVICDEFTQIDSRVRTFHKKNGGLSDARNFGIKNATGSILCFVDGDDFLHEEYLNDLYSIKKKFNANISECACYKYFESKSGFYKDDCREKKVLNPKEWLLETNLGEFLSVVAWNKLYDRNLFDGVEYPTGRNFEDESTTYKVVYKSKCIARTYRKLYYYRQREGSITQDVLSAKVLNQKILALNEKCDFFIEKKEDDIVSFCQAKYSILVISNFDYCNDIYENDKIKNEFYRDVKKRYMTWVKMARCVPLKYKIYIKWFLLKNRKYDKEE